MSSVRLPGIFAHMTKADWVAEGMQNKPVSLMLEASYDDKWMTAQWVDGNGNACVKIQNVKDVTLLRNLTVSLEFENCSEEFQCSFHELQELQQFLKPLDIDLFYRFNPVANPFVVLL